ncbi:MAG: hypothetical protein FWG18_02165, partial [Alphaproteobacteria bacterium]|nr:hypothetical protein [Alphaproteobacteria bacterium]
QKRRKVVDAEGNPILDEHGNQKFQGIGEWNAEHRKNKVLPKELLLSERKLKASDAETAMDRFRGYMARWDYLCNPWNQNWVPWKSRKKFIEERSPDGLSAEPKHMRGQTNDSGETDIGFRNDKGEWQDKGGTPEQHKYNEFFAHYDINIWGR